jgi:transcription termination/antitermination protein NusA
MATINMQIMRYINLLNRITRVRTSKCFVYNNVIIFAVPARMLSKTIGPKGKNVREMQEQLGKKVRIIEEAHGIDSAEKFVKDIVEPVVFVSLEVKENEIILTAGARNKAALLGRHKRRLLELSKILEDNFGKELRIV